MPKARSRSATTESSARSRAIAQATLWAMVDAPTPPLAPTMAMIRPTALASGAENRLQIERTTSSALTGAMHVVADAAAHQFAIQRDVVDAADHDDAGSGIADGGELIEAGQDVGAALGLQDDHVRRRRGAIGLDGGRHAAHLDLEMGLAEAAVFAGRLHGGGGFHRLAEGLHRHARRRRDVIVRRRRASLRLLFGILARVADHLPVSLSLALSASG